MKRNLLLLLFSLFLFSPSSVFSFSDKDFKAIIQRYAGNSGVKMSFEKETHLKLLKKKKVSKGHIYLSKNQILLKIQDHLKTRILFDGSYLWYVQTPPKKKPEIIKVDLTVNSKSNAFISFLFKSDFFFQHFRFNSSQVKGRSRILHFEPLLEDSDMESFSVKVEGKLILMAWLKWRNLGNEEKYTFSNIQFNQKFPAHLFQIDAK